jgi:hypothetical protein
MVERVKDTAIKQVIKASQGERIKNLSSMLSANYKLL